LEEFPADMKPKMSWTFKEKTVLQVAVTGVGD